MTHVNAKTAKENEDAISHCDAQVTTAVVPRESLQASPSCPTEKIRQLHRECILHGQLSVKAAIRIGEVLTQQKNALKHGKWLLFVEGLPFCDRTARRYMKLYRKQDKLKSDSVSDLAAAYRLLTTKSDKVASKTQNNTPIYRGKYNIILADPPWNYSGDTNDQDYGGATYPSMKLGDIKNLTVNDVAAHDALVFLWATGPKLTDAIEVLAAWGFEYQTIAFAWYKNNRRGAGFFAGLGAWTKGNVELCLLGKKGKPIRMDKSVSQVVEAPVGKHSAKPDEVRGRIVQLVGDLPRIELFARNITEGWDCLGNEIDGKDIRDELPIIIDEQRNIKQAS